MIVLNTAMANQLKEFKKEVDAIIEKGVKKDEAIFQVLRQYIIYSKAVRFEGNGYSKEWEIEAEKRGLTNIRSAVEAFKAYISDENIELFKKENVLSKRELEARYEVRIENYTMKIQIEARVLGDLAINHIIPTAIKYQTSLIENVQGLKQLFDEQEFNHIAGARLELIKTISKHISSIKAKVKEMTEERKVANKEEDATVKATLYEQKVKPYLDDIRYCIDKLELVVDDEMWPLPKYRELLFN
jgi:glutamine synthetase